MYVADLPAKAIRLIAAAIVPLPEAQLPRGAMHLTSVARPLKDIRLYSEGVTKGQCSCPILGDATLPDLNSLGKTDYRCLHYKCFAWMAAIRVMQLSGCWRGNILSSATMC
ncbi:hypothetical protein JM93_03620 [Roseibium hamelinense]|uniref:Uncharacterized protein n=1 Tax=Roseibium hamelinense TaxID=150831 RepID=A0A562SNL1_9HYPH|nr:hypothetical protein JM93_03620 [Roseibium hamelinense]